MNDETTINERPRKRLDRFEWSAKKKAILRELADVINRHGFDNDLECPDFLLAEIAVSAMYNFGKYRHRVEDWEFGQVVKNLGDEDEI